LIILDTIYMLLGDSFFVCVNIDLNIGPSDPYWTKMLRWINCILGSDIYLLTNHKVVYLPLTFIDVFVHACSPVHSRHNYCAAIM